MKSPILIAAACLLGVGSLLAVDTQPPVISSIAISPSSVDVTASSQTVTVTVRITDDESGFRRGDFYLYRPGGTFGTYVKSYTIEGPPVTGDALDGTYEVQIVVPRYGQINTWRVDAYLYDEVNNSVNYGPRPGEEPFANPADATFSVVNSGLVDNEGPTITNVVYSTLSVDTASGSASVTANFDSADALTGNNYGFFYLIDPEDNYRTDYVSTQQRVSGDEFIGSYQVTATLPQGSMAGTWKLAVYMRDELGNSTFSPYTNLIVTGVPASLGSLANALDAVQYEWLTSNPGFASKTVVTHDGVDAAASQPLGDDDVATMETTVTGPGTLSFWWMVDSEAGNDILAVDVPDTSTHEQISGNESWQKVFLNIPSGSHTVVWSYSKDSSVSSGADRGWVDQVQFLADSDDELPVLQSVRITPDFVNVSQTAQTVTVTFEASDDYLGISGGYVDLITSSGDSYSNYPFDSSDRINGDANYGTYEVSFEIENTNDYGIWSVEIELEEDGTNNTVYYGPEDVSFPNPGEQYLTVVDVDDLGDAPLVKEITLSTATVNVTSAAQNVIATLHITDEAGGFASGYIYLAGPSGQAIVFDFDDAQRTSGDKFDGMYDVPLTIPLYAQPGNWKVGFVVQDFDNNSRIYPEDPPYIIPGSGPIAVINNGVVDVSNPAVTSFQVSSNSVNTSGGPVNVTVNVTVTDNPAGLKEGQFSLFSPSDDFYSTAELSPANRTSGDINSGTYQFDITFPMNAAPGVWKIRSFTRDNAGNTGNLGYSNSPPLPGPSSASITVVAGSVSTYQTFVAAYSLTGPAALANADPDHDGVPNALELLLGSSPTVPGPSGLVVSRDAGFVYLDFTVAAALAVTSSGDLLEIRNSGTGDPLRVTGQTQSSLGGIWTDNLPVLLSGKTYRVALPIGPAAKGFARLYFQ